VGHPVDPELRLELTRLIIRRVRVMLCFSLVAVVLFVMVNHTGSTQPPLWTDAMNLTIAVLIGAAFSAFKLPFIERHPVPFALLIFAVGCTIRALAGVWHGDVAPTALMLMALALTTAATLPWGVLAQTAIAAIAASAIAVNSYVVSGNFGAPPGQAAATVVLGLVVSIALAVELQRHRVQMQIDNLRRRQAEARLAQLNVELELRVMERTSQLAAANQRLESEAHERQQATHELHESQKRLRDILDNASASIHLKDVDGRYLLVNRYWEATFGLSREQAVGKTVHDMFPTEVAEALRANDRKVLALQQPLHVEEVLPHDDGLHTYISVKFPLFTSEGTLVGVCGISTDITARQQMEAELRRSRAALSVLVENTTDAIWSVDRKGTILVMNRVFLELFRQRFGAEFDLETFGAHVPESFSDDFVALYERAFKGEHVQVERSIQVGGELRHFLISVHPVIENGVATGATVFSKDLTDHKRAEEQVRQHQAELAHVLRLGTMGEMAAGLAHEINQPLGAIANYAQGSVRHLRAGSMDGAALLPVVEAIAGEALRAGEIIRRLRDLLRKESPQQEAIDVNTLVRRSIRMIEPEARQHDIDIRLELAPDLPQATCDGVQIEQVLLNLLLNGVEAVAASDNGERAVVVTTAPAGADSVEVSVRDSGIGIPDPPANVFKPFFSTKPNGLGMGLSISRSLIEAHGGRLQAARNPDHGSTFRFTLPAGGA
jgi:PAS domain S-box-containing protein